MASGTHQKKPPGETRIRFRHLKNPLADKTRKTPKEKFISIVSCTLICLSIFIVYVLATKTPNLISRHGKSFSIFNYNANQKIIAAGQHPDLEGYSPAAFWRRYQYVLLVNSGRFEQDLDDGGYEYDEDMNDFTFSVSGRGASANPNKTSVMSRYSLSQCMVNVMYNHTSEKAEAWCNDASYSTSPVTPDLLFVFFVLFIGWGLRIIGVLIPNIMMFEFTVLLMVVGFILAAMVNLTTCIGVGFGEKLNLGAQFVLVFTKSFR